MIGSLFADIGSQIYNDASLGFWNWQNMEFSKKQFQEQKRMNRGKYQIAVADLRKAGINPLLAFGGGAGGGMQTSVSGPSAHAGGGRLSIAQSAAAIANAQSARIQAETAQKQNEINDRLAWSQVKLNRANAKMLEEKRYSEIADQMVSTASARRMDMERQVMERQIGKIAADIGLTSAQQKKTQQETLSILYDNYKKEAQKEIYKGTPGKIMSYTEWLTTILFGGRGVSSLIGR